MAGSTALALGSAASSSARPARLATQSGVAAELSACTAIGAWCGVFASSGFAGWDGLDGNLTTPEARRRYFRIVPTAARLPAGRRYFRALVDAGAVSGEEAGQRSIAFLYPNERPALAKTAAYEGSNQWYHTSLAFPRGFRPSPQTEWNWVLQWHDWPDAVCCANIAMTVDTSSRYRVKRRRGHRPRYRYRERLSMRVMGGGDPAHPVDSDSYGGRAERDPAVRTRWFVGSESLRRGHWYDVLLHVRWSYRGDRGFVAWWLDGRQVMAVHMPTLHYYADAIQGLASVTPGPGQAYWGVGYYRPAVLPDGTVDRSAEVVYHDGVRRGPTRSSVRY